MGENSKIEWTDHTFNPWVGCQRVSDACANCYAESLANRYGRAHLWRGERERTSAANWRKPIAWNAKAEAAGARARVFCASLADVFEVPPGDHMAQTRADLDAWRSDLWALIDATPHLDWLLLTKRPENIRACLPDDWDDDDDGREGYPNVWLGTTVENQEAANTRIPYLLGVPARVHFLSCEPLLGPVDLRSIRSQGGSITQDALTGYWRYGDIEEGADRAVRWVIAGGESGPGARASVAGWFRALRDDCGKAGVPFLFKQWGEHDDALYRVGKAAAGRHLDGVLHDAVPVP